METAGRIELFLALVRFVSLTARTPVLDMSSILHFPLGLAAVENIRLLLRGDCK